MKINKANVTCGKCRYIDEVTYFNPSELIGLKKRCPKCSATTNFIHNIKKQSSIDLDDED